MAKIKELLTLQKAQTKGAPKYGLICQTDGDGSIDYDAWENTEVFTNADDFLQALVGQFEYFLHSYEDDAEQFGDNVRWRDLVNHPEWDQFCEAVWIKQNFFK